MGFSIPRIIEVLLTASIVGGVTLYGTTAVIEERLEAATQTASKNEEDIRELRRDFTAGIKELTKLMFDIRIELTKSATSTSELEQIKQEIERHERQFTTIWPRLREMKERIQALEPKDTGRWQY